MECGGKAKEYVLSRGGSAKKYERVLGGRGGQKASKLGVRTLWMAPKGASRKDVPGQGGGGWGQPKGNKVK